MVSFTESDAELFFGRDSERVVISSNLMASQMTVLYGPSGVGKSSLLRAGVAHEINALAIADLSEGDPPGGVAVVLRSYREPVTALDEILGERTVHLLDEAETSAAFSAAGASLTAEIRARHADRASLGRGDLAGTLRSWSAVLGCRLLVILDQFEDYFLYNPSEQFGEGFAAAFSRAVTNPEVPANFLVSLREDSLAGLDRFKPSVPDILANRLRLANLSKEGAERAIRGPIEVVNRDRPPGQAVAIEKDLVAALIAQVQVDDGAGSSGEVQIEAPFLSLALDRLWRREDELGSTKLRLKTLNDDLGGAKQIVRGHLDRAMAQLPPRTQATAAEIFNTLLTPTGTKIALSAEDLAAWTGRPVDEVTTALEQLAGGEVRILRPVPVPGAADATPRYEIFHDLLAPAIIRWRTEYANRTNALTVAAAEWKRQGHAQTALISGASLRDAIDWADTHPDEVGGLEEEYLRASRSWEKQRRTRRWFYVGAAILLVAMLVGALVMLAMVQSERNRANETAEELRAAQVVITELQNDQTAAAEELRGTVAELEEAQRGLNEASTSGSDAEVQEAQQRFVEATAAVNSAQTNFDNATQDVDQAVEAAADLVADPEVVTSQYYERSSPEGLQVHRFDRTIEELDIAGAPEGAMFVTEGGVLTDLPAADPTGWVAIRLPQGPDGETIDFGQSTPSFTGVPGALYEVPDLPRTAILFADPARLRDGPTTNSAPIEPLIEGRFGEPIEVLEGPDQGWFLVDVGDQAGWIYGGFIWPAQPTFRIGVTLSGDPVTLVDMDGENPRENHLSGTTILVVDTDARRDLELWEVIAADGETAYVRSAEMTLVP